MRRFVAALLLLFASTRFLQSQTQSATFLLRGRVVAAANGDPIRTARVSIRGANVPAVLTDQEGRFEFTPSRAREYALDITKPGYSKAKISIVDPTQTPVIALQRGAVIAGTVVDETGEPAAGVSVMLGPPPTGDRPPETMAVATTDDLGQYRFGGLAAQDLVVNVFAAASAIRAVPGGGLAVSGPGNPDHRIYYPGVPNASRAQVLTLHPGDELTSVDFTIEAAPPGGAGQDLRATRTDAVIEGSVVRADGRKLAGAIVRLAPTDDTPAPARVAFTTKTGDFRFVLAALASGTYRLSANRIGYLPKVLDTEIVATSGRTRDDVTIPLARAGAITGRLFDEYGDPVEGAVVRAMQVRYRDGRRQLVAAAIAGRSDDLGRYRLGSLQPGRYVISASVGQVEMMEAVPDLPGYGTTYFPGTPDTATAQFVQMRGAGDTVDASFALARTTVARVSGQALDAAGEPITGGLSLIPSRRGGGIVSAPMGARIEREGRFEFPAVAPGDYVLHASRHRSSSFDEGESFAQFVTVAGDVTGLAVRTAAGSVASGTVVFEGGGTLVPGQLEVSAIPVDADLSPVIGGPPARVVVDDDLRFTLAGLRGPRRIAVTRTPPGWSLKSIALNGTDVTDAPIPFGRGDQSISGLEITLTPRATTIVGSVNAAGRPRAGAVVLIAGVDRSTWYPRSRYFARGSSGRDGTFTIVGLPPGEYLALAITAVPGLTDGDDWQDPDYLDAHAARATRITLVEGAQVPITLAVDR